METSFQWGGSFYREMSLSSRLSLHHQIYSQERLKDWQPARDQKLYVTSPLNSQRFLHSLSSLRNVHALGMDLKIPIKELKEALHTSRPPTARNSGKLGGHEVKTHSFPLDTMRCVSLFHTDVYPDTSRPPHYPQWCGPPGHWPALLSFNMEMEPKGQTAAHNKNLTFLLRLPCSLLEISPRNS